MLLVADRLVFRVSELSVIADSNTLDSVLLVKILHELLLLPLELTLLLFLVLPVEPSNEELFVYI